MKNVLQIELNKAIKTRYFAISIIIGTIIAEKKIADICVRCW